MGVPMSRIAQRFGYSIPAISRYRDRMPQQLKAAIVAAALKPKEADLDKLRIDETEGILGNLAHQRARLLMCQDECMDAGAVEQVARLSGVIHKNIELTGRYLGLFAQHHVSSQVNIMISEDYLRLRQALTMALRPFPEARRAVAEELHRIEGEIAQKMLEQAASRGANRPYSPISIDRLDSGRARHPRPRRAANAPAATTPLSPPTPTANGAGDRPSWSRWPAADAVQVLLVTGGATGSRRLPRLRSGHHGGPDRH